MHYKSIALELLRQHPNFCRRLCQDRAAMQALDLYSGLLKDRHQAWQEQLSQTRPGSGPEQISSEALELALQDLRSHLPQDSAENEPFSLDAAIAFLRRHTPSA